VLVDMSVQDNGRGMSESELDALFQDFEQVLDDEENHPSGLYNDNGKPHLESITLDPSQGQEQVLEETSNTSSPPKENPGTPQSAPVSLGLGLAMAARFVRLNCGQISIASEKGKGTTVTMKIPFRKARPDVTHSADSQNETSLPTPPMLTPDAAIGSMGLSPTAPGILERSLSADTILPVRHQRSSSSGPGPEGLAAVANVVAFTSTPTFDPSTGRYPFLPVDPAYHKVNVLVAEDNPLNSRLLETRSTRRGHIVKVTTDGQACAETFKKGPDTYDVILMDLQACFPLSPL
jgi:CheY-like chemotaxis protein